MERSVLDTDTFSEVLRGRDKKLVERADAYLSAFSRFTLSATTIAELADGYQRLKRFDRLMWLENLVEVDGHEVLPIEGVTALIAGRILGDLHRTGQPIGRSDPFIAAIAIRDDILLVTGNTKHFERIIDLGYPLRLDNWRAD